MDESTLHLNIQSVFFKEFFKFTICFTTKMHSKNSYKDEKSENLTQSQTHDQHNPS